MRQSTQVDPRMRKAIQRLKGESKEIMLSEVDLQAQTSR